MKKTEKYLKKLIDEMPEYNGDIHFSMDSEDSGSVKKRGHGFQIKYIFAAACILILLISVPVAAKLPFVTERMQAMPQEEIQDLADMINALHIPADLFSRPFSEEERMRMKSLREEYENGIFPDEDILIVSGNEQADVDFYYNRDTGMFILPDSRELTDEELRQYIDFSHKVDYSLQTQYSLENHASEENENNYDITDLEVPEEHKEFIQACLMVLGINDSELTNLHIEKVHDDASIAYSYQTDTKTLSFSITRGDFLMEEDESEEMITDEGTDFMRAIDETQNYKSARETLEIMCGDEWTDASAWYYCQSVPEGYLQNNKYAYIFVDDEGKDLWFSYRYGEIYPSRIWISSFERFTDNLKRVQEHGLYERLGVEIEDHLMELDIETGEVISAVE